MTVNIIMPAYNGHKTIRQAIASVAMQDGIDQILLTIVDDCSDSTYDYILSEFPYINIEILRKPTNTGCGQSRQYGIDRCKCKYFMFLDTDDCLYTPMAVKQMYSFMECENLDSLYRDFIEELDDGKYILRKNSGVWMHGKMFRTKYIQDNNIRYSETRLHEDHAFNIISKLSGGKNRHIDAVTYLWKYNENSLTRCEEIHNDFGKSMESFLINAKYTINELIKREINKDEISDVSKKYILSFYRYYNTMLYEGSCADDIKIFLKDIKEFYEGIPREITDEITLEYLTENFYQEENIREMIDTNIIFVIPIGIYYIQLCNPTQ